MSIQTMPNTGLLMDDSLDRLRGDAIAASQSGLPEPVVYYLRALEHAYLNMKVDQKHRGLREIGWKHAETGEDA